jgi:sarcosine oxidase subunit beta
MAENFDVVVVGGGVVGASTAYHLAALSDARVALVERDQTCSGGTAKSCAIVRTHYSVTSNTALTVKSLEMFHDLAGYLDEPEADAGFVQSGYLILAGEGDASDLLRGNLDKQAGVGAETYPIAFEEARERHPLLDLTGIGAVGYEPRSGYADPYLTTTSFLRAARNRGVTVMTDRSVREVLTDGDRAMGIATDDGMIEAGCVVLAIGPWMRALTDPLGIETHLEVSRHTVLTLKAGDPYERTTPVVKDLSTENKMYFRPATGGVVLVGTGDHGDPITDPDAMSEAVADDFVLLQGGQITHRMPSFAEAGVADSWVGAYDITPDWNPVLGPIEQIRNLHLAYGFSGHGFKLAPAVGLMLARTVLGETPEVDISGYGLGRFDDGALLTGAYGIGSIS